MDRPKTWKGLCKKDWDKKQKGDLLYPIYFDDDNHCWYCGKKLDFSESHHQYKKAGQP